jgi:hypothetical protein
LRLRYNWACIIDGGVTFSAEKDEEQEEERNPDDIDGKVHVYGKEYISTEGVMQWLLLHHIKTAEAMTANYEMVQGKHTNTSRRGADGGRAAGVIVNEMVDGKQRESASYRFSVAASGTQQRGDAKAIALALRADATKPPPA